VSRWDGEKAVTVTVRIPAESDPQDPTIQANARAEAERFAAKRGWRLFAGPGVPNQYPLVPALRFLGAGPRRGR
jgi:hypothetical protein